MTDEEFLAAFLDARLTGADFNHQGHIRTAWLLLQRHPLPQAIDMTCSGIQQLATKLGAPQKYNHTLTEALVRLMAHGGAGNPALTWQAFLAANAAWLTQTQQTMARHYTDERLFSDTARRMFVSPDLAPLPE